MNSKQWNEPEVSIITPVYNAEEFLMETIESVKNQTFQNWEMILVDDGSTDDSLSIINSYSEKDKRIRCIQLQQNSGAAIARNTGIEHSDSPYIAFLDSDDLWLPEKLETQLKIMKENQWVFTHTAYEWIDGRGKNLNRRVAVPEKADYKELLKENTIGCLTAMVNIEQTGPLKMPDIRARQDYALWLSIAKKGFPAHGIDQVLACYRERKHSLSSNKLKMVRLNWYVYRKIERLSFLKSCYYFTHFALRKTLKYTTK